MIPPDILIHAYTQGIFPMAEGGKIQWFAPKMRGIIPLDDRFRINRGLRKALKKEPFTIRRDSAFADVMWACAERETTWIDETIVESYTALHQMGLAHSIECWDGEGLQGGLYGVRLGRAFFGESMFSRKTDASKIALVHLVEWLRDTGGTLLDTQWTTPHLQTFGAYEMPQEDYLILLHEALDVTENDSSALKYTYFPG